MAIKSVSKERIDTALHHFDQELRGKREWLGWESNLAHRYAIQVAGKHYPAKKIVSLATGVPVSDFSGGHPTNSYLQKRGFTVIELPREDAEPVLQFTPGAVYDRKTEINGPFGGSRQSGIAPSRIYPAIFLFTGDTGEQYGYTDRWENGAFLYTGEGQIGPMTLTRGNRAIAEHAEDGRALHLFESLGKGKGNRYVGEFACADVIQRTQPDLEDNERLALVFRLVPVGRQEAVEPETEDDTDLADSLEAARLAAFAACKPVTNESGQSAPRKIYQRSRKVAHYVMLRARGECESCSKPAPFRKKDGTSYLEPHHVNRLSDGGLDHPRYVGAICPSCHREIHSGTNGYERNKKLKKHLEMLEP
ncbi:HNH endonuclease [Pseudomonas sp. PSKL.D1]|uniref:HNH endonuclease n=1 Tax=Pseudomonas sp. PSKL.D1 TaxID=3029060 RepID=UPI0023811D74|nr:HNH endonuclease signature motif containing protein [Pseudomonas sp. PSKL.D1]WDY56230.1 HNH endonuclease signature motif containing protein [Pseudomonas sp. PSKL.D1]